MKASNYPDLIEQFATLALAFQADSDFESMLLITKHGIRFELHYPGEFAPKHVVVIRPEDDFEAAADRYVQMVDLLEFKQPSDFELKQLDQFESMRQYYQKNGTKGEF